MKMILFLVLSFYFINPLIAQPSAAKVKSDAVGNGGGVISFKFTKSTGTRQWNSSAGNWEYVRGVQIKRKSDYPGINLIVDEDVVYQYVGNGGYSFWKVRVLSNSYEGIPNPTAKQVSDFISKDWEKFYAYYYSTIVKLLHQPMLADNPEWVWHDINSVEFRMKMKFDHIIRAKGIETVETIWKVRFYRDDPKAPWKSLFAVRSDEAADSKIIGMKEYTLAQMGDFEKQTLEYTMAEKAGQQQKENLSKIIIVPDFKNADEMLRFLHDVLRNGTPDKLRAVMLQTMAPGFFVAGSQVQLLPDQERNLADVIRAAYNDKVTYKQLYCQVPFYTVERWGNSDTRKDIKIKSVVENCNTAFTVDRVNTGYMEGVPVTRLAIISYGIYVRQDQDVINYINSFTDRKKLCPGD
jgi:hypothetical protein